MFERCVAFSNTLLCYEYLYLCLFVQRIDVLVKQTKYNEALALALSFYDGRAKAVIGLTASSKNKKEVVSSLVRKRNCFQLTQ